MLHSLSASAYSAAWNEWLILLSECLKCILCRFLLPTMPGEMTTGRRIQFIGESRLPITNLHPALPCTCPALPCPALPCLALPPLAISFAHVKSSLCSCICHQFCANMFAISTSLHLKNCSKHTNKMLFCLICLHIISSQDHEVVCYTIALPL